MIKKLMRRAVPLNARQFLWHLRKGSLKRPTIPSSVIPQVAKHELRPAQVHALEASSLLAQGLFDSALQKAELAAQEEPNYMKAQYNRLRILARMGRQEDAISLAKALLLEFPIDVSLNRIAQSIGHHPEPKTVEAVYKIIASAPDRLSAAATAVEYFHFFEAFEEALHAYDMGLAVAALTKNQNARTRHLARLEHWRALATEGLNNYERAAALHRSLIVDGGKPAQAIAGLSRCLLEMGSPNEAYNVTMVSSEDPFGEPQFVPLMMDALQASNRIKESYALYRKRAASAAIASFFGMPDPSGIDFLSGRYRDKRVLLLSEGGPGDEMRFSSLYSEIASLCGDLTITCDPRLASILRRSFPNISFLPADRWRRDFERSVLNRSLVTDPRLYHCVNNDIVAAAQNADLVCSLLDTLVEFRPNRAAFRDRDRDYLTPDPKLMSQWASVIRPRKPRLQVGISWRSMLRTVTRNRHYLSVDNLSEMASLEGVDFWSLQPEATDNELAEGRNSIGLQLPIGLDLVHDIEGQLAFCANLDLIIAPFTTTGEIGGALGTHTLLIATTGNTTWRREIDGSDLFSPRTMIVRAADVHDKRGAMRAAAQQVRSHMNAPYMER